MAAGVTPHTLETGEEKERKKKSREEEDLNPACQIAGRESQPLYYAVEDRVKGKSKRFF